MSPVHHFHPDGGTCPGCDSESIGSDCSTDEQAEVERSENQMRSAERQALAHFLAAIKWIDQQEVDADYKIGHIIAIGEEMQRCLSENRG